MTHDPREALEPCPFCGTELDVDRDISDTGIYWVMCHQCCAEGPPTNPKAEAIKLWNTRVVTASPGEQKPPVAAGWNELPSIPDDDADFTPDIARKIIAKYQQIVEALRRAAPAPEGVADAPGHTDLMVTPESIDAFMEANPLPRPDAGGGVREQLAEALAENKALRAANTQLVLAERDRIEAALSTPPAAAESNASVEARLREAKIAELQKLGDVEAIKAVLIYPDDGPTPVPLEYILIRGFSAMGWAQPSSAAHEICEQIAALSAVGDEAKKSEGGVDWDDVRGIAPNATGDLSSEAFIREQRDSWDDKTSDPTAERREIVARALMDKWPGDYAWGDDRPEPNPLAFETADAILAALDGGAGE